MRHALGATLIRSWDFKNATSDTIIDSIGGAAATLESGNGGPPPVRAATGIQMFGTGPTASDTNAGGFIALDAVGNLTALPMGGEMTIEVVGKFNAWNYWAPLFAWGTLGSATDEISFGGVDQTEILGFTVYKGVGASSQSQHIWTQAGGGNNLGQQAHLVATVQNAAMRIYIGGVLKAESTAGIEPNTVVRPNCYIGRSMKSDDGYFAGEVSSFKLYDGAMTQVQVTAAYKSAVEFPALLFAWDFKDAQRDTVADTISGINATLMSGNGGPMPQRTVTGIAMVGSGPNSSSANAGGYIGIDFGSAAFGGTTTIETVVVIHDAFHFNAKFFDCGNGQSSDNVYLGNFESLGQFRWSVFDGGSGYIASTTRNIPPIVLGMRIHVVVIVQGSVMALFLNGKLTGSHSIDDKEPNTIPRSKCYIGRSNWANDGYLSGEVSSLKLYAGAMTSSDVREAYEAAFPFLEFDWDFRGGSGTTITDSIAGVVATLRQHGTGAALPTRSATGVVMVGTGPVSAASNAGGYIELGLGTVMFGGPMTVEMIVKFNNAFNWDSPLLFCGNAGMSDDSFVLYNNGATGELTWDVFVGSIDEYVNSGSANALVIGVRYHVVTTVARGTMSWHINGAQTGTVVPASNRHTPLVMHRLQCYIGKSNITGTGYFDGEVSSLKIYSGAMSQAQVAEAYEVAFPFLEFYWDFTNAGSDTIIDSISGVVAVLSNGEPSDRTATGIVLDGHNESITLSLGAIVIGGPLTIEAIFTWTGFQDFAPIFDCGNGNGSDNIFLANSPDGSYGELRWNVLKGNQFHHVDSGTATDVQLGIRYHIVATVAGTTMRSYINGVLKGENTTEFWEPTAMMRSSCFIGRSNFGILSDGMLAGEIESLKIYTGAMSLANVIIAFNASQVVAPTAMPTVSPTASPSTAPTSAPTQVLGTASPSTAPTSAPTQVLGTLVDFASPLTVREDDAYTGVSTVLLTIDQIMAPLTLAPTEIATIACNANASFVTFSGSNTITAGASGVATDMNGAAVSGIRIQGVSERHQISARTTLVTCAISAPSRTLATIEITVRVVGVAQPSVSKICALLPGESPSDATLANCGSEFTTNGNQTFVILGGTCAECPQPPFDGTTMVTVGGAAAHAALVLGAQGERLVARLPSVLELLAPGQLLESFDFTYYSLRVWTPAGVPSGEPLEGAVEIGRNASNENGEDLACATPRALCPRIKPAVAGIFYTDHCQGFFNPADLTLGPGWNQSAPPSPGYAFGRPPNCRPCPEGCRCPGGSRCRTVRGYFAPGGEDLGGAAAPIKCAADDELAKVRCAGWSSSVRAPAVIALICALFSRACCNASTFSTHPHPHNLLPLCSSYLLHKHSWVERNAKWATQGSSARRVRRTSFRTPAGCVRSVPRKQTRRPPCFGFSRRSPQLLSSASPSSLLFSSPSSGDSEWASSAVSASLAGSSMFSRCKPRSVAPRRAGSLRC